MSGIEYDYTLNPVTALAFYQPGNGPLLVLAGEGAHLKFFEDPTAKLVAKCKIFSSQPIHGITVKEGTEASRDSQVVVWGGRSFIVLDATDLDAIISFDITTVVSSEILAPDWILDGAISPFLNYASCVFITARSALHRVFKRGSHHVTRSKSFSSQSQSSLYSAHALWTSQDSVMVAGGTVFGEIEVTLWLLADDDENVRRRQVFSFSGHEGSIFGVRISPEIIGSDGKVTRRLASCSDDRTIRIWDLSLPEGDNIWSRNESRPDALTRETGFGKNENLSLDGVSSKGCIAVTMAHASRIWRVEFITWKKINLGYPSKVHVLSFGEDSSCCHWSIDPMTLGNKVESFDQPVIKSSGQFQLCTDILNYINTYSYHTGKHIWSAAVSFVGDTGRRLATGGADGKIAIYDIVSAESVVPSSINVPGSSPRENEDQSRLKTSLEIADKWDLEELFGQINFEGNIKDTILSVDKALTPEETRYMTDEENLAKSKKKKLSKMVIDAPSRYTFVGRNRFLITTSFGRVLRASVSRPSRWEELIVSHKISHDLKSYSLTLGAPECGIAFLVGANGVIYMYHDGNEISELARVSGKPAALINVSKPNCDQLQIFITTLGSKEAQLLFISVSSSQHSILDDSKIITLPENFIVTSAGRVGDLLVLGSRNGSLAVYENSLCGEPIQVLPGRQLQSDEPLTSITMVPSTNTPNENLHFLATSRNRSYSIFSLSNNESTEPSNRRLSISLVHQAFPHIGLMIERAWFSDGDLMLYGFRSKSFVVWNETKQSEVARIECGGAHRSYTYLPGVGAGGLGYFVYTKASRLYLHSISQPSHKVLKSGGHGREIKACEKNGEFIATGAEDTTIRIWRLGGNQESSEKNSPECCAVVEKHSTGIQHLKWCRSKDGQLFLFSSGGAEEFYVWAISAIPGFGVGVVCEAKLNDQSEDRDLRIMGCEVDLFLEGGLSQDDARQSESIFRITLIYSDSVIRGYYYSRALGFRKIAEAKYTSACLMQIKSIYQGQSRFFTAATDGHLTLWEYPQDSQTLPTADINGFPLTPPFRPLSRAQIHQSSISALDVCYLSALYPKNNSSGTFLVATGGDDNALALTLYEDLIAVRRILVPSAHAAAITGVAFKTRKPSTFLTSSYPEVLQIQLWSIGGDQRVKLWHFEIDIITRKDTPDDSRINTRIDVRVCGLDARRDDVWCSVADAAGLVAFEDRVRGEMRYHVLVFGNGMEIFGISDGDEYGEDGRGEYAKLEEGLLGGKE